MSRLSAAVPLWSFLWFAVPQIVINLADRHRIRELEAEVQRLANMYPWARR